MHVGHRQRDFEDGLGIGGPGRWRPKNRVLPELGDLGKDFVEALELDKESWNMEVTKMMLGRTEANPLTKEQVAKGRAFLEDLVEKNG